MDQEELRRRHSVTVTLDRGFLPPVEVFLGCCGAPPAGTPKPNAPLWARLAHAALQGGWTIEGDTEGASIEVVEHAAALAASVDAPSGSRVEVWYDPDNAHHAEVSYTTCRADLEAQLVELRRASA